MKILLISDTHNRHRELNKLPAADVVVHCGDVTENGTAEELGDFLEWFSGLPYRHKIFVAGNHDFCLHREMGFGGKLSGEGLLSERPDRTLTAERSGSLEEYYAGLQENSHFLNYSGTVIDGVKFYGLPYSVADDRSGKYWAGIDGIPDDVDILISHEPPCGVLDFSEGIHWGNLPLLRKVTAVRPGFHIFGHIHASPGTEEIDGITYINACRPTLLEL